MSFGLKVRKGTRAMDKDQPAGTLTVRHSERVGGPSEDPWLARAVETLVSGEAAGYID